MTLVKGRNINSNDTATMSGAIVATDLLTATVAPANTNRIFFCINNNDANKAMWVKLQGASVDDDHKGIFVPKAGSWMMPSDNMYTGEISVISDAAPGVTVYYTEY